VVEADGATTRKALISEIIGIVIVYVIALLIRLFNRNLQITNEILARTAPNFIDMKIVMW
jgi:hypothetical protein